MSLLDRLFRRRIRDNLIREVERWLNAQGHPHVQSHVERMEVRYKKGDGQVTLNLENLLREYTNASRAERKVMLDRFLRSATTDVSIPPDYESAKPTLLPIVRSAGGMALVRQSVASGDAKSGALPVQRLLVADIVVGLVVDRQNSMSYVQEATLANWGVTWEQALQAAIDNLRGLSEQAAWKQVAPGVWSGEWGDAYESSRLLLPDLIYRLGINAPVAMAPFRDALLVTSAASAAGINNLVKIAYEAMDDRGRWVSFELLRLDGSVWSRCNPTDEAASRQSEMILKGRTDEYESQRHVLERQLEDLQLDIFVATCTLVRKSDGSITNYAVWSENVDTLLPEAEAIVLVYKNGGEDRHARFPWSLVREKFGHLMERTDYLPARHRVRQFPESDVLQQLAAAAKLDW